MNLKFVCQINGDQEYFGNAELPTHAVIEITPKLIESLPKGQTLKRIRDKYYLYQQTRKEGKIICTCLGHASEEQIALYTISLRAVLHVGSPG